MALQLLTQFLTPAPSLLDYINERIQLDSELRATLSSALQEEKRKKGAVLVAEERVAHRLYFLEQGSARSFYYHDGKEITSWIYREGQLLTSWTSFFTRVPAFESVALTEDSSIVSLSYDQLQDFYRQYTKLQAFGRIMVEEQLAFLDYFYKGFLFMSAKEKYDLLLSIFPDVTQRVNLGHIASFLGISQETLSRIRKKG